jgi:hypothetical protein
LTGNEIVVTAAEIPAGAFTIAGEGYALEGAILSSGDLGRRVWSVVLIITAMQSTVTCLPPLQAILETRPAALTESLLIVGIGAPSLP